MSIQQRLKAALEEAWAALEVGESLDPLGSPENGCPLPDAIDEAARRLIALDSAPDRGMALAIAAGTAEDPRSDPSALQVSAGVDRRGQAKALMATLTAFRDEHALKLKISKEPGVSNPWREPRIDGHWVRSKRLRSAPDFLVLVEWLSAAEAGQARQQLAEGLLRLLARLVVEVARSGSLAYPRFKASPRLAMRLVRSFLAQTPNRPDALEAVVSAAVKAIAACLPGDLSVERGDTNSPDPIDVLVTGDGVSSGVEVVDMPLTLTKLQHEVVPAMQRRGLLHVAVVAHQPDPKDAEEIQAYISAVYRKFEQRIDILTVDDIETWLAIPGLPESVASWFVWEIGTELDRFSALETRRAWLKVLDDYAAEPEQDQGSP